jgi:hypothetical protein
MIQLVVRLLGHEHHVQVVTSLNAALRFRMDCGRYARRLKAVFVGNSLLLLPLGTFNSCSRQRDDIFASLGKSSIFRRWACRLAFLGAGAARIPANSDRRDRPFKMALQGL